ncbi:MAG: hypothetical protein CMJ44_09940 [Pimelobacter sp.]|nr:hypothetical protein [Pimelobacter sp.]
MKHYAYHNMSRRTQLTTRFIFQITAQLSENFIFIYLNVAGSLQRGEFGLTRTAMLSPLYWGLMSYAAWKGFIQLFTNPFYWEKTEHGLDEG